MKFLSVRLSKHAGRSLGGWPHVRPPTTNISGAGDLLREFYILQVGSAPHESRAGVDSHRDSLWCRVL